MEVIKKYQNRKLYSTTLSKYVTLNYILDLEKTDQKFQIIDVATKKDITTNTLQSALNVVELKRETIKKIIKDL